MSNRVETGPVQFDDDWPGVFIRGDNAFMFASSLEWVISLAENNAALPPSDDVTHRIYINATRALLDLLRGSHMERARADPQLQKLERKPMT